MPTFGEYVQYYNPSGGLIIAEWLYHPREANSDYSRPGAPIPNLNKRSDVTFLEWQLECEAAGINTDSLRYMVDHLVVTRLTVSVIFEVLRRLSETLDVWPGTGDIAMETDEGKALLGTPHGSGIAWLLADHRALIPKKVDSVIIFSDSDDPRNQNINLLWKLKEI